MTAQIIDMMSAIESRRVAIASTLQPSNDINRAKPVVNRKTIAEEEARKDADFLATFGVPRAGCDVEAYVWPELVPAPWAVRNLRSWS